ncbi:MAG: alpha/beta hydrolase [Chloroflexi bacterium]|nr:alpha/beta hydrolase [Chloroflexota bacterium]
MATNPTVPEDKWLTVNGLRVHYLDWGGDWSKRPLYLLHGLGGHAHAFDKFAPLWAETHHVIAIDERGCGDSDWSREGYSVQAFAADVGEFALKTGLYPFDYYGHSQGSRIGMVVGAYYGHLVSHLVLGDYGPERDPSPAGRATAQQRMEGRAARPKGFFSPQQAFDWHRQQDEKLSDEDIWHTVKYTYRRNWDGILVPKTDPEINWLTGRTALKEGPFLWECVSRVSCKTLVLRGGVSTVLDKAQAQKMAALIPNGKGATREVPGAGHGLQNENMEGAFRILREFFET